METEDPEQFKIQGELLAASKSRRNYLEIESLADREKYSGDILESAIMDIELTIGHFYEVTFEELTSINPATGEEKIERKVIDIKFINDSK